MNGKIEEALEKQSQSSKKRNKILFFLVLSIIALYFVLDSLSFFKSSLQVVYTNGKSQTEIDVFQFTPDQINISSISGSEDPKIKRLDEDGKVSFNNFEASFGWVDLEGLTGSYFYSVPK